MRKRLMLASFVALVGFVMGGLAWPVHAAETFTVKAVSAWPKTASEQKAFDIFSETLDAMVKQKAPGELKIDFRGGPEAVKTPDLGEATQRGMVDMMYTTSAYYVSILPEVDCLKLSRLTPNQERTSGAWAYMNQLHNKVGLYYLARLGLGTQFHIYLKKPIKTADLKGFNIRISPMYIQVVKALGGNPINIPPTEVYSALERNVVDGYCWPSVGIGDWGWQKQTKYVVDPGFYQVPNPLVMNLNTWNKLPKKLQDVMTAAATEAEKKVVAYFDDLAKKERPILTKDGVQTITLPKPEADKLLTVAYDEGWKDIIQKNPKDGAELRKLFSGKK